MTGMGFIKKYEHLLNIYRVEQEAGVGKSTLHYALAKNNFSDKLSDKINDWYRKNYDQRQN